MLRTLITGTIPITIVWQHNSSNLTNNNRQIVSLFEAEDGVLSILTISDFREDDQGSYRVIASNNRGLAVSPTETLTLGEPCKWLLPLHS